MTVVSKLTIRMHKLNCSIHTWGREMADVDVEGSIAYSHGLEKAGIITSDEQRAIEQGLGQVREEWVNQTVSGPRARTGESLRTTSSPSV